MLISALLAMALFAEPAAASSGGSAAAPEAAAGAKPAAAEAKPEMRRVCEKVAVENSRAPKKKCRMVPARSPEATAE
jgi:hypothetical protein